MFGLDVNCECFYFIMLGFSKFIGLLWNLLLIIFFWLFWFWFWVVCCWFFICSSVVISWVFCRLCRCLIRVRCWCWMCVKLSNLLLVICVMFVIFCLKSCCSVLVSLISLRVVWLLWCVRLVFRLIVLKCCWRRLVLLKFMVWMVVLLFGRVRVCCWLLRR